MRVVLDGAEHFEYEMRREGSITETQVRGSVSHDCEAVFIDPGPRLGTLWKLAKVGLHGGGLMHLDYALSIVVTELHRATFRRHELEVRDSWLSIVAYVYRNMQVEAKWTSWLAAQCSALGHRNGYLKQLRQF